MKKNQHIVKTKNGWGVKGENNSKVTVNLPTQAKAIEVGKKIAKNQHSELIIHKRNGKIRAKYSYGRDPFPPKG